MTTINLFHLGDFYYFKHYFQRDEVFGDLRSYYDSLEYRFEVKENELEDVLDKLRSYGFDVNVVEEDEVPEYAVIINKYEKHGDHLKNSVDTVELEDEKALVMKDKISREQALEIGEEPDEGWEKLL